MGAISTPFVTLVGTASTMCETSEMCGDGECAAAECTPESEDDGGTTDGLGTWGDGRTVILGTKGYIELRKYIDIAGRPGENHLFIVNQEITCRRAHKDLQAAHL